MTQHHILSVLVENRAGVLARVASLFARRGYNIFSLAVAPSEDARPPPWGLVVSLRAPLAERRDCWSPDAGRRQRAR